jgi:hypothetical protein
VVAHLVDVLDLAVDPGDGAIDDRRAGGPGPPRDSVEAGRVVVALRELPAQVGLVAGEHVDAEPAAGAIAAQVALFVCGRKPTIGGSSDTDVNEPMVKPTGAAPSIPVMIVTPVGKWPNTVRNCLESKAALSDIAADCRRWGRGGRARVPYAATRGRCAEGRETGTEGVDADDPASGRPSAGTVGASCVPSSSVHRRSSQLVW